MSQAVLSELLSKDPLPWILESDEAYAQWVVLTGIQGLAADHPDVLAAHDALLADPGVQELIEELPVWGEGDVPGHDSPKYLPNRLYMLADMGLGPGDSPVIEERLDSLLSHQNEHGRFESFGRLPKLPEPQWNSMPCDTNMIADVLLRFGRGDDLRVETALKHIEKDAATTPQGKAWQCLPEKRSRWRGPGRKADTCPQVTLEGLRALSHLPETERPEWLLDVARTPLEIWRRRLDERPYIFGHGYQFKSVKWPNLWYDVLWVVETIGRFPELWTGEAATAEDRKAIAELAACLIAYNIDEDGRVVPRRTYRRFERFSFGQKKAPSPFATARMLLALSRLEGLAEDVLRIDVNALGSSKGGSGTPKPPKGNPPLCPIPSTPKGYPAERATPRIMARHHLGTPWIPASTGSIVADLVGLQATSPTTPYVSLFARLTGFRKVHLDRALYEQRSLVRLRCFRGTVFLVRRDLVVATFNATRGQTVKYAREFSAHKGVTDEAFEHYAPIVMELLGERLLTAQDVRKEIGETPGIDLAALVNRMSTEGMILCDRPRGGWKDRQWTYVPFSNALPELRLDSMAEEDADIAVVRAYVRGFAPTTAKDASWWTGIGTRRVAIALEALGDEIIGMTLVGSEDEYLVHAADIDELSAATLVERPSAALLPSMDPLLMGYGRKERFVADEDRPYVFDSTGNSTATILIDGKVAGVWDVESETGPTVILHSFQKLSSEIRDVVEKKAADLGTFWHDRNADIRWTEEMTPLAERVAGAVVKPLRA